MKKKVYRGSSIFPCTAQQNGIAKRMNLTLLDMAKSIMAHANLLISFWGHVLLTAAYILTCVSSKSLSVATYELWHGRKLLLDHLCPWGSINYVHNPTTNMKTLVLELPKWCS